MRPGSAPGRHRTRKITGLSQRFASILRVRHALPIEAVECSNMKLKWKQYAAIGGDLLAVFIAFLVGKWLGFALAVLFIVLVWGHQTLTTLQTTRDVLLSRLPDRCALCHREILDESGVLEDDFEGEL